MRKGVAIVVCIFWLMPSVVFAVSPPILKGTAPAYPRQKDEFAAALVIDVKSQKELYVWKPDTRWPIASVTKLMSSLVTVRRKPTWSQSFNILKRDEVGGGRLRVPVGAVMTVKDLLYSSLVGSANNAAMAFSRVSGLGPKAFVTHMNRTAASLGMSSSTFVDPSGMSPENLSTVRDLVKLANVAFADPNIRKAVGTAKYTFMVKKPFMQKVIMNTNRILTAENAFYVHAGKTGYLEESRHNLVVKLEAMPKSPAKQQLLIIVLGAPDKEHLFATAEGLAEWAWMAYDWPSK
jgi:serine-type D-Ala-D-Ala endopeptidase (penicillin-binding protein 7)